MIFVKEDTDTEIPIGPFVDATDGVTAETGLTIAAADIRLKKGAADWAAATNAATHEENGWYRVTLAGATDINNPGMVQLAVHEAGAVPVFETIVVLAANVYDSLIGGGDTLDVQVTGMGAGVVTAAAIATDAIDADAIADNAINAGAIAADAITAAKIADGAIDAATFAAGAITASAIASDAIGAAELAADAVTEIVTGVWAKAMTELASVPGVTGTVLEALQFQFLLARNKMTQTATTTLLRNDADSATIATSTVSDDGTTFTRGEFA